MGFFDGVADFFSGLVDTVINVVAIPLEFIFGGVDKLVNWIFETKELSDAPSYDPEEATIDETVKYNELLSRKREEFTDVCVDLEKQIQEKAKNIQDAFIGCIRKFKEDLGLYVDVDFINNEFDKFIKELDGGISNIVSRRLALSDNECVKILGEEAGDKRSSKIDRFLKKIIEEGLHAHFSNYEASTSRSLSLIQNLVTQSVFSKELLLKKAKEELENLNRELSLSEKIEIRKGLEKKSDALEKALLKNA